MIKLKIDSQSRQVLIKLTRIDWDTRRGIRQGLYFIGRLLRADASKDILRKPRTGRVYKYKGRKHIASVRGESPANRSGNLRRSLMFKVHGFEELEFGYTADYGKFLEDEQKLNRPALKLAIQRNEKNARSLFEKEMRKALGNR